MKKKRLTPEQFLVQVNEEEKKSQRGKLKVFLGAAPGVGKTTMMLQDAIVQREQKLDVVVGVVESHGRKEIEHLLTKLERLPLTAVDYHNKKLHEFDLDGALKRNPALLLIDEMAHTNAPGLRHVKRWQDIKEVLDRGMNVYTTINIQHVESLNDIIAQILGIRIRETVPDSLLELADTIELVDLPPDDLIKRLKDGKVYIPQQIELAAENFFRKSNLVALRELALRFMADRVSEQVLLQRLGGGIEQIWPTAEIILVCVGPDPESPKMIRAARRLASSLHAKWIAVYVEAPRLRLSDVQRHQAIQHLRLAEQLGAETRILTGFNLVTEIIRFARDRNVTKIVIGKRIQARWKTWFFPSLMDELIRNCREIDIYIIRSDVDNVKSQPLKPLQLKRRIPWKNYGIALGVVSIATSINFLLVIFFNVGLSNLIMVYFLGVVMVAMVGHRGSSLLASILTVLTCDFFFIPPQFSFDIADERNFFTLAGLFFTSQIISYLTIMTRGQVETARLAERRIGALHVLSQRLASTRGIDKLLEVGMQYLAEMFDAQVMVLLPEENYLGVHAKYPAQQKLEMKEYGIARWVYEIGQIAGFGTNTLPSSEAIYIPLPGQQGPIGVIRVCPRDLERLLIPEQMHFLVACANQIALALAVDRLQEESKETKIAQEAERLRNALFNSISHELQNPLATIVGSVKNLVGKKGTLDEVATHELTNTISQEADQLNRLLNNLLQITELEEGKIKLHKKLHQLNETIRAALKRLEKKLGKRVIKVRIPAELPLIPFDPILIEQVFVNLLENAILYSGSESPIIVAAVLEDEGVLVTVADRGPGLMLDDIERVFDKFYRGQTPRKESGAGLGLAVCRSIVYVHGGRIWAENRPGGGAVFRFTLMLNEV